MSASEAARTLRAVAEAFVPGPPLDPTSGALEARAEDLIAQTLDDLGVRDLALLALDAYAASAAGATSFADLPVGERTRVLLAMGNDESGDVRDLVTLLFATTVSAVYGEWAGLDRGRLVRRPPGWDAVGYPGPSRGYRLRPARAGRVSEAEEGARDEERA